MIIPTIGGRWSYQAWERQNGVDFMCKRTGKQYSIEFTGKEDVCLDWASMSRGSFFDKYADDTLIKLRQA